MKKQNLFLSAAFIMAASAMFAQTNKSTVVQEGINAVSKVVQDGSLNTAIQYQKSEAGLVDIYQKGNSNYANQDQDRFYLGRSNSYGKNQSAIIKQIGNSNKAWQTQRWDGEHAFIEQKGNSNVAHQSQYSNTLTKAEIYQNGNGNRATQTQNNGGGSVQAYIRQSSNSNTATQTQNGGIFEYAEAIQTGTGNTSTQTQAGRAWSDYERNIVKVNQSGDSNTATQDQSNFGDKDNNTNHSNVAEIVQSSNSNNAVQNQYGLNGFQRIEQKTGAGNYGYQYQDATSVRGEATLMQNGRSNWSQQWQYGTDNTSNVNQTGNSMRSKVTQNGVGNLNTVTQTN